MSAVLSQEGIDLLTHLPKGNAEAELMSVIPVFYVYHYLEAGHNWDIFSHNLITKKKQELNRKLKEGKNSHYIKSCDFYETFINQTDHYVLRNYQIFIQKVFQAFSTPPPECEVNSTM